MLELLIAGGILGFLLLVAVLDASGAMLVGAVLAGIGLLASFAAGWLYHVRLRAALVRLGGLERLWWLAPTRFHARLDEPGRQAALPWFRAGAVFMGLHGLGVVLYVTGAARLLLGR